MLCDGAYLEAHLFRLSLPQHCPYRGDEAVHEGRGDVSPFPSIPAGSVGHGELTDSGVDKPEESEGGPRREDHRAQLHGCNISLPKCVKKWRNPTRALRLWLDLPGSHTADRGFKRSRWFSCGWLVYGGRLTCVSPVGWRSAVIVWREGVDEPNFPRWRSLSVCFCLR